MSWEFRSATSSTAVFVPTRRLVLIQVTINDDKVDHYLVPVQAVVVKTVRQQERYGGKGKWAWSDDDDIEIECEPLIVEDGRIGPSWSLPGCINALERVVDCGDWPPRDDKTRLAGVVEDMAEEIRANLSKRRTR